MTWLRLALANLGLSPLTSAVNIVLMALGTASIVLLLLAGSQLSDTMSRDARGIDVVLGAKGSPVQLVLSAVYHADIPTGNINLQEANTWIDDPRVEFAIPVALGDSYRGFRIVGTEQAYADLYGASLASGEFWEKPLEAVVGSNVAEATGLEVGASFTGAHGLVEGGEGHESHPYRIVGVLESTGTVLDRLILTDVESVWLLHSDDEHDSSEDKDVHSGQLNEGARESEHESDHDDEHDHDGHTDDEHEGEDETTSHSDHESDEEHGHDLDSAHGSEHESEHEHEHGEAGHVEDEHEGKDEHGSHSDHEGDEGHEHHLDTDTHDEQEHEADHDHETHGIHSDHESEITAVLIGYSSPLAAMSFPREVNTGSSLQAASPAMEISRILQLVGVGLSGLRAFAWVLILTAALSVFAALYSSLRSRRGDLAMLRCLGATRIELLIALLLEGLLLTIFGIVAGLLVGHGAMELLGAWLENTRGVALTGWVWIPAESLLLISLLAVGVVAAIVPAVQAYRTDVARTLAEG